MSNYREKRFGKMQKEVHGLTSSELTVVSSDGYRVQESSNKPSHLGPVSRSQFPQLQTHQIQFEKAIVPSS